MSYTNVVVEIHLQPPQVQINPFHAMNDIVA